MKQEKVPDTGTVTPEPASDRRRYLLDRYEGSLIVALLFLVAGTQFWDQVVPTNGSRTFQVIRGEDSTGLGEVDLRSVSEPKPLPQRDLNTISRAELLAIPGIGPALADAILQYRREHGEFTSLQELLEIPGIGPKRLKRFSRYLEVPGQEPADGVASGIGFATGEPVPSRESSEKGRIDLNEADREELMSIPGIGGTFADRILRKRAELKRFQSWSEVDEVPGVGPKRLENLKAHATIE